VIRQTAEEPVLLGCYRRKTNRIFLIRYERFRIEINLSALNTEHFLAQTNVFAISHRRFSNSHFTENDRIFHASTA
jgi:hypothetical protein